MREVMLPNIGKMGNGRNTVSVDLIDPFLRRVRSRIKK